MASSRWKRFAFFERQNLNVDPDVWEDFESDSVSFSIHTAGLPASTTNSQFSKSLELDATDSKEDPLLPTGSTRPANATTKPSLVLGFMGSQKGRIHCYDLTQRCNGKSSPDLDGWRGYVCADSAILGLAASRSSVEKAGHAPLYLAVISRQTPDDSTPRATKVSVWEDPHLHLKLQKPFVSTPTPDAAILEPLTIPATWTIADDGNYCCVDIRETLVAVGTTNGAVLVFWIYQKILKSYLRIPPPSTGVSVLSVKLSVEPDKGHIFVAYDRSEGSNVSGLCCYDFPLPSLQAGLLSAPQARHDLDGRLVSSANLVDADFGNVRTVTVVRI